MTASRKLEIAWAIVRFAIGLPLFIAEAGLTTWSVISFCRPSSLREQIEVGFLAVFFAVQGWMIWRVPLSPTASARSRRTLARTLQGLDPLSQDFYVKSSGYF